MKATHCVMMILLFAKCNQKSPADNQPCYVPALNKCNDTLTPIVVTDFTKKAYRSKAVFLLKYDTIILIANRISFSKKPPIDTPRMGATRRLINRDPMTPSLNTYIISAEKGEQYNFRIPGIVDISINNESSVLLLYKQGKLQGLYPLGDTYLEALDSLTLQFGDSMKIHCAKGSAFYMKIFSSNALYKLAVFRGLVNIEGGHKPECINLTIKPGKEIGIWQASSIEYYSTFDSTALASWRNGGYLIRNERDFGEVMNKINSWFSTNTVYKNCMPIGASGSSLSIAFNRQLESTLRIIESAFPVTLKKSNQTIYVYNKIKN